MSQSPQNSIVGTWKLVSWENRTADGQVSYPFGKDAIGSILYSADGYMSVAIMTANRPNFVGGDILGGTLEEKAAAMETYISYGGRYELQEGSVTHYIEVTLFPNWVGVQQKRFFKFEGNQLLLSTPPILQQGQEQTGHLIWQRVEA